MLNRSESRSASEGTSDRLGGLWSDAARTGGGSWVGRAVRRREDERLLRGAGHYVADVVLPGALEVAFLRSAYAHARLVRVNSAPAEALPGVVASLSGAALTEWVTPPAPVLWKVPAAIEQRVKLDMRAEPLTLLADERVRYVGEPVAIVAAENRYLAEDALELIEVEYAPLPVVASPEDALRLDSARVNPGWSDNVALSFRATKGEPDRAFASAHTVVRERFRSHRYTGVPIETRGIAADFDSTTRRLTVWCSTQVPHTLRNTLAEILDMPLADVRVVAPDVGGGFGIKGHLYSEDLLIPLLARRLGRAVRWTEDRQEHLTAAIHDREQIHEIELAADAEGRLLGLRDRILFDMGASNLLGLVLPYNTMAHLFGPYEVPSAEIEARAVLTNKTPRAAYRGAGRPEAVFAMERALERLSATMGIDPAELRLRNLVPADRMPYDTGLLYRDGHPLTYDSGDFPAMYRRALELLEYDRWRARGGEGQHPSASDRLIGLGLAGYIEGTGIGPFETGSVSIDPVGRVHVATGSCSQGQGHATTFAQVTADVLSVPLEQVEVVGGDTDAILHGFGTLASRSMATGGSAVAIAAARVRDLAREAGAELLEVSPEDVELVEGAVRIKGAPGRAVSLGRLAQYVENRGPTESGQVGGLRAEERFEPPTVTFASGVHAALVEVDVQSGQVTMLRYVVVHDCGRVVNPTIVDGQVAGGVAQGLGGALYEEIVYDESAQILTTSLMDYLLPTASEVPGLVVEHHEHLSPRNPLGVKGLGEAGAIGPPAAVANAVEDALRHLGVVVRETPLSPSRVRAMIRAAGQPSRSSRRT